MEDERKGLPMKDMKEIVDELCSDDFNRARSLKNIGYQYALANNLKYHKKGKKKYYDEDAEFLIKERLRKAVPKPRTAPIKAMTKLMNSIKYDVCLSTIIYKINPMLGSQESRKYRDLDSKALAFIEDQGIRIEQHGYDYYVTKADAEKLENYLEGKLANTDYYDIPESKTVILLKEQNARLISKVQDRDATIARFKSNEAKLHETIRQLTSMLKK
jgi:hypothetical protein